MSRAVGVVVAAGKATRFGGGLPKQFLDLGGETVAARSVRALASHPGLDGVIVVLPPEEIGGPRHEALARISGVLAVVPGGASRAHSTAAGVAAADGAAIVLVHDAARPFVGAGLVARVLDAAVRDGAAVPVLPVSDTVKETGSDGRVLRTLDRARLRLAQTPQGSRRDWLLQALERALAAGADVTDEAQALERDGRSVTMVDGEAGNVKITRPEDLEAARARLDGAAAAIRVGIGFDIHRFGGERPLILGGVRFDGEPGLDGHSDADVVLHAAMDAVLGAASLGDIGSHFPPGDPRFAGADSRGLAEEVVRLVGASGWVVSNLDLSVLAERPRIRPAAGAMRDAIAGAFGIPPDRVGIKATTLEGMGALGRGEGIACQAVALLRRATGAP